MREIARRPAEASTEIDHLAADADPRATRQRIIGGEPAIMILVVRKQIFRLQSLQRPARRPEFGEDDLRGDRVLVVEVDGRTDPGSHGGLHREQPHPNRLRGADGGWSSSRKLTINSHTCVY
jgi:hypothetical protein